MDLIPKNHLEVNNYKKTNKNGKQKDKHDRIYKNNYIRNGER